LYIVKYVGEERALEAIKQLNGKRAFPFNIARILKIKLPEESELPSLEETKVKNQNQEKAKMEINKMKKMLRMRVS